MEKHQTAEAVIKHLELEPLIPEGGYYRRTYPTAPSGSMGASSIYYLMTRESFSSLHLLTSDEIWHFYQGDPIEQVQIYPDGTVKKVLLGQDIEAGQIPMTVVPAGVWQGSRLLDADADFALCGCTVVPDFIGDCYTHGIYEELISQFPDLEETLRTYCSPVEAEGE